MLKNITDVDTSGFTVPSCYCKTRNYWRPLNLAKLAFEKKSLNLMGTNVLL